MPPESEPPKGAPGEPAPERRFTFDEVAELYDRARPGYPAALVDDVIALGDVPAGGRVLEIGCGTGQATRAFAERGLRLLCLEPGANLARVARARLARFPQAAVVETTFEAWPLEPGGFDLVMAAQSFHWVDPAQRFGRSADALRPGGALAVFGNAIVPEDTPLRRALDRAYAEHAPGLTDTVAVGGWYRSAATLAADAAASGRYGPVESRIYPWTRDYGAAEYSDLLLTHSDHRLLAPGPREALLAAVRDAIEAHGGSIEARYEARLYVARRAR
jgi:SAM-dependent methyltransferase